MRQSWRTADRRRPELPRWRTALPVLTFTAVTVAWAAALLVPLNYLSLGPGQPYDVGSQLTIDPAHDQPTSSHLLSMTVRVRRRLSAFEALTGWRDSSIDVIRPQKVFGAETRAESVVRGQIEIADAKTVATVVALRRLGLAPTPHGLRVLDVLEGTPASALLHKGDVIVVVDGRRLCIGNDLSAALADRRPGDIARVELADRRIIAVPLVASGSRAIIGIGVKTVNCALPFAIRLETGPVIGPSGGLAMTLGILDRLSPGELLGGGTVAVTGTIEINGRVGPIGGVKQKTIAARRAGAKLFIVPNEELAQARSHAGPLSVVGVATLDDALRALRAAGGGGLPTPMTKVGSNQ